MQIRVDDMPELDARVAAIEAFGWKISVRLVGEHSMAMANRGSVDAWRVTATRGDDRYQVLHAMDPHYPVLGSLTVAVGEVQKELKSKGLIV